MPKKGYKFTPEQLEHMRIGHLGQVAWNKNKKLKDCGHDPSLYKRNARGVSYCLGCTRENGALWRAENREQHNLSNRLGRHHLTVEQFQGLWNSQNGCCGICLRPLIKEITDGRHTDGYRIDHDPTTGIVRGILCHSCNTGIGILKHSRQILENAISYLEKPRAPMPRLRKDRRHESKLRREYRQRPLAAPRKTANSKGVRRSKNKWLAEVCYNGKHIYLGYFTTDEEAARVRDEYIKANGLMRSDHLS